MKSNIISIFISVLLSVSTLYAQNEDASKSETKTEKAVDTDRLKPVDGNWGFSFNLNGLIDNLKLESNKDMVGNEIIFIRKYLKDDLALRAGFGLNSFRRSSTNEDSLGLGVSRIDSIHSRTDFLISLGVEKHIGSMRRLDPYVGGEVSLQLIGTEKQTWDQTITEPAGTTTVEGEYKLDGGTGIGVFGILGFNYFIAKNIALGAEYRFGYNYLKMGGNFSNSVRTTPPTGDASTATSRGIMEQKESGFQVNSTGNIVFSIFF